MVHAQVSVKYTLVYCTCHTSRRVCVPFFLRLFICSKETSNTQKHLNDEKHTVLHRDLQNFRFLRPIENKHNVSGPCTLNFSRPPVFINHLLVEKLEQTKTNKHYFKNIFKTIQSCITSIPFHKMKHFIKYVYQNKPNLCFIYLMYK